MSDQPTSCTQEREPRSSRMDSPLGKTIVSQLTDVNLTYALPSERWRRSERSVAKMARGAFGSGASFGGQIAASTGRAAALRRAQTLPGMRAWWCRLAASHSLHLLSAGCRHSIDEQAASGDHAIAGGKTVEHLDRVAIGEPDLDPLQLDRLFTVLVAHQEPPDGWIERRGHVGNIGRERLVR